MYNNYIFDLYGTLIDIRTDEWADETWDKFAAWLLKQDIVYTGRELHHIYDEEVARLVGEAADDEVEIDIMPVFDKIMRTQEPLVTEEEVYKAAEQFRKISTKFIRLYPETEAVLSGLKKAGKKVYLLSNAQKAFTWQELTDTGIDKYFDDIFISSEVGYKKPSAGFMKALLDKHGLGIEESIMVGNDSTCDVAVADAVGMDAAYLRTEISPKDDPTPDCKYVFEDGNIGHVLDILKEN